MTVRHSQNIVNESAPGRLKCQGDVLELRLKQTKKLFLRDGDVFVEIEFRRDSAK